LYYNYDDDDEYYYGQSMCGAGEGSGNILSPDDSVQFHSFASTAGSNNSNSSNSNGKVNDSSSSSSSSASSSVSIALARSGVLCNLAEAHNVLGETDRATERLSDALKALQSIQTEAPHHCAPALGRVLGK